MTSTGGFGAVGLNGGAEHAVKKVKKTEARRRMGMGIGPVTFKIRGQEAYLKPEFRF
jgi:hypothetical protein